MGFLKAITLVTLWILLSFFWVSLGQSKERECLNYGNIETWLKPHPVLVDWYRFYVARHACDPQDSEFFKALASSEFLSTRLNQAKVTFDQFYVPLTHLMMIRWDAIQEGEDRNIQSELTLINHGIHKILSKMDAADQDYFRANVLLDLPSEFVEFRKSLGGDPRHLDLSRRLNKDLKEGKRVIDVREVTPPPYERVYPYKASSQRTLNLS